MIDMCQIMRGMDRVKRKQLLSLVEESTMSGHCFRARGRRFKGDLRNNYH